MFNKEKLVELIDDNLNCIEFSDDTFTTFQELAEEFGCGNLAKAIHSAEVRCTFAPSTDFFIELRNSLMRLQEKECPTLNFVCSVNGVNYSYDILTNFTYSDAFIRLVDLYDILKISFSYDQLLCVVAWDVFSQVFKNTFKARLTNRPSTWSIITIADAKNFLDNYLPPCFDRENILPQKIIDIIGSPFPKPTFTISKLEPICFITLKSNNNVHFYNADDKVVVSLQSINNCLAKVTPSPFKPALIKAAIKKNIFRYRDDYFCELADLDDILRDVGDAADNLRQQLKNAEISYATMPKCTIHFGV